MDIEMNVVERQRPQNDERADNQAEYQQDPTRVEKQSVWHASKIEKQTAAPVAPGVDVRRAPPTISRERRRNFGDPHPEQSRFDQHLQGDLHAQALEVQAVKRGPAHPPEAAVHIAQRDAEENARKEAQKGIANVAMEGRHGARGDTTAVAIANDDIVACAQLLEKAG